jgi:hypothetical protein
MLIRAGNAVVAWLCAACLWPALATADTQVATSGATRAVFRFTATQNSSAFRHLSLTIQRAGVTLFLGRPVARGCRQPFCAPAGRPAVHVRDLDGDGEPEVRLDLYTGGAHCCFTTLFYRFTGATYAPTQHDWLDAGYRLRDLDRDGRPEFVSADARFAFRFASFAGTGFPIQIFAYTRGRVRDVTRAFPAHIRRDARIWRRQFNRRRDSAAKEPLGALAAWVGDQYLLGRRAATLGTLRRLARRGELRPRGNARRFIRDLDRFLRRIGYARR